MTNKKTFIIGFTAAVKSMFEVSKIIFTENQNFKYISHTVSLKII